VNTAPSVKDLLGIEGASTDEFPLDESTAGFGANWQSPLGEQHMTDFEGAAQSTATLAMTADPDRLRRCTTANGRTGDDVCVKESLTALVKRAFHRTPETDEIDSLLSFHTANVTKYGKADADQMFVASLLLTPQFLYVVPPHQGAEATSRATRLAFFLTGGPPDTALVAAAESGALDNADSLATEVDRLLAKEGAFDSLEGMLMEWLEIDRLEEVEKDTTVFSNWNEQLRGEMLEETERFIAKTLADGGGIRELLTSRTTEVTSALAKIYGVEDQHSGPGWASVTLPSEERAGILTQASFLAGHSHASTTSWVFRGKFIRGSLLCEEMPAPPAEVDQSVLNDNGRLEDPACAGCHILMDPIGKAFDRYDALGGFDTKTAAGDTIPSNGELIEGSFDLPIAGVFDNPVQLAERIGESQSMEACMTLKVYRFAQRRFEQKSERCEMADANTLYSDSGGDFKALLRAIALSPSFSAL